jgi:hypothetical protein
MIYIYIDFCSKFSDKGQKSPFSFERSRKERSMKKESSCPHKGEYPEREKFFSLHQTFTWRLIGSDADTLCVECAICGWRQVTTNIDRLGFLFGGTKNYLPRHP